MLSSYEETLEYLFNLHRFGMKPGLETIQEVLAKFDNPEKSFRVIHIAGTNGKGSVAAMIANILKKADFKVGLFTSPHLITFRERIQVNNCIIPKEEVIDLANKIRQKTPQLTFFETITVMAYLYFQSQKVDFVVLETGLGGRLDATNTVNAEIAIITSIAFDHTHILGNTIEEIATEKAEIIKQNATVITSVKGKPFEIIKNKAAQMKAKLMQAQPYQDKISLRGDFQKENAGIAYEAAKLLNIDERIIKKALGTTFWPARCEYITHNILIDCAHNLAGIKALTKFVKTQQYQKLITIFGVQSNKNFKAMIKALPKPDFLVLTKPRIQKALDPKILERDGPCKIIENPKKALKFAQSIATQKDLILITGSCYLVGNILEPEPEIKTIIPKAL